MKKALLLFISAVFAASICYICTATVSASEIAPPTPVEIEEDDTAQTYSTSCIISFVKTSSTTARAESMAARPGASSITATLQLQKKSNGSWVNTSSKSTKTVQSTSINHVKTFTISSSNTYRLKVTIKYVRDGITLSNSYYKTL